MIFCRIADVSLKEAKMSEGALKSNLFQGVDNTDGMDNCTDWNGLHESTESLASHMSRMRDQKKLQ